MALRARGPTFERSRGAIARYASNERFAVEPLDRSVVVAFVAERRRDAIKVVDVDVDVALVFKRASIVRPRRTAPCDASLSVGYSTSFRALVTGATIREMLYSTNTILSPNEQL